MIRAKKTFGQHFLKDRSVLKKIIQAAELRSGETVLEVGPGTGVLTQALLDAGARVIAIEADRDLVKFLQEKFGDRITLIQGNALSTVYRLPSTPYQLIANIPYNITSALLEKFLSTPPRPSRMVLLLQREVADRLLARPPHMSLLAVACQMYADIKKIANVPAGAFSPPPKVESAIVRFDLRANQSFKANEQVIALAKAGFRARRKQLHRNLDDAGVADSKKIQERLTEIGLDPKSRAENLSVEQWKQLFKHLFQPGFSRLPKAD